MTKDSAKPPKKEKKKPRTAEERLEAVRYSQMMYGPTAGEMRSVAKKIDFGAAYLKHPKFQSLMAAFKNGSNFQFSVADKGRSFTISTDGLHVFFEGKVLYYARDLNKFERSLLLDRQILRQYASIEAFVHLVFAVPRSLPELGATLLSYRANEFFLGAEELGTGMPDQGTNIMIGTYKTHAPKTK